MTGLVDRLELELYAARTARPRDSARYAAVLERAVRTCGADSQAAGVFDLGGSGVKYKKCCAAPSVAAADAHR
jgi:hypothetical protein